MLILIQFLSQIRCCFCIKLWSFRGLRPLGPPVWGAYNAHQTPSRNFHAFDVKKGLRSFLSVAIAVQIMFLKQSLPFIGSHCFQFSPQSLCFWSKSLPVVEINYFRRSIFFLAEAWWKLLPLIETFPFSGSHSLQCFNIFTGRSYQK